MKRLKAVCIALFLMCAMIPMDLYASSQESAVLKSKDNQVFATLTQLDPKDDIRSLQLSFQIKVVKGTAKEKDISFQFDKNLPSEVQEYRYHHDTGILTVYLSGKKDLYANETLTLGSVSIAKDSNAVVEVSVIADSFKAVENQKFKNDGTPVQIGEAVQVATGSMIDQNQEKPDETDPDDTQNKDDQKDNDQKDDGQKDDTQDDGKQDPDKGFDHEDDDQNQTDEKNPDTGKQTDQKDADVNQESGSKTPVQQGSKDTGNTETGDTSNGTIFAFSALGALVLMGILMVFGAKKKINQK